MVFDRELSSDIRLFERDNHGPVFDYYFNPVLLAGYELSISCPSVATLDGPSEKTDVLTKSQRRQSKLT